MLTDWLSLCSLRRLMAVALRPSRLATLPAQALRAACTCAVSSSRDLQTIHSSFIIRSQCPKNVSLHHTIAPGEVTNGNEEGAGSRRSLHFPRRVVMYVPASDERKVRKTAAISVDSLVFDLEDGVAINKKEVARKAVGAAIATSRRDDSSSSLSEHVVRVNGVGSGLLNLDLREVFRSCDIHGVSPDAIMLPKADTVEHIAELDLCLSYHAPSLPPLPLYIITESPLGLLNLRSICDFATHQTHHLTLSAVVFGSDDFLAAIGGVRAKAGSELVHARQTVVGVASANGVSAIDMVSTDFTDLEVLKEQSEEGAGMGFTGKQVIHPAQVGVVQEAYSPSPGKVGWATGLISAFHQHQQSGKGAFVYEGKMVDRPLLLQAQNIVNLHSKTSPSTTTPTSSC